MKKEKLKAKAIVLSLVLAALLPATTVSAQGVFGDMLDNYYEEQEHGGMLGKGGSGSYSEYDREDGGLTLGGSFSNGNFGETDPAPLGSGIAILMGLGLGYVALKKKED